MNDANCGIYSSRMSHPIKVDADSNMGFLNSFWFTFTGFFLQSTSVNPKVILFLLRKYKLTYKNLTNVFSFLNYVITRILEITAIISLAL